MLCVCCFVQTLSSCSKWGLLLVAVSGFFIAVASPAVEHRLEVRGLQQPQHTGPVVVAHGPGCPTGLAASGMWDLLRPGIEPVRPALLGVLPHQGSPHIPLEFIRRFCYYCEWSPHQPPFFIFRNLWIKTVLKGIDLVSFSVTWVSCGLRVRKVLFPSPFLSSFSCVPTGYFIFLFYSVHNL